MDEIECRNYSDCQTGITAAMLARHDFVVGESGEMYCSTACAGEYRDLDPEG